MFLNVHSKLDHCSSSFKLPTYLIILYEVLILSLVLPTTSYKTEAEHVGTELLL